MAGCRIAHEAPLYDVQLKRKRRGASVGAVTASVIIKGALKRRLCATVLRSPLEIRRAFERKKGYS